MKREILFKGKRVDNGEWVEGFLLKDRSLGNYITEGLGASGIEVYHETVCQFTGLLDKHENKGFFGDIWEVKDFKYNVNIGAGFITKKTDLKFYLTNNLLEVGFMLIDAPKELERIALSVIFNLPLSDGKRMFIDEYRQKLEIIGNIHD